MVKVSKKISEVRETFEGLSKDISDLLSMAEISIPIAEDIVAKVKTRVAQIERLFGSDEEKK